NGALGVVIEVGTNPLMVKRTVYLPPQTTRTGTRLPGLVLDAEAKLPVTSPAAISPDGQILVVARQKGVSLVDVSTLSLLRTVAPDWAFGSLRFSPDNAWLYAVDAEKGQLLQIRPSDGASVLVPGAEAPVEVLRVDHLSS